MSSATRYDQGSSIKKRAQNDASNVGDGCDSPPQLLLWQTWRVQPTAGIAVSEVAVRRGCRGKFNESGS
jgi:hypothetical protein